MTRRAQTNQDYIEFLNAKQSKLLAAVERTQKLRSGAPDEILRKVLQDVTVLGGKISKVENELLEKSEEMRKVTAEIREAEVDGLRFFGDCSCHCAQRSGVWSPKR